MTLGTILQIFTNPFDLEFVIYQDTGTKKYGLAVLRGPQEEYRPLLTGNPLFGTREEAVSSLQNTITQIATAARKVLNDPNDPVKQMVAPGSDPLPEDKILNDERIGWIVSELRAGREASTCKLVPAVTP